MFNLVTDAVFRRLEVNFQPTSGALVSWELDPLFKDSLPHTFQLEVSYGGTPESDDWVEVGAPAVDTFFLVDDEQRLFGKTLELAYRVRLTTPRGEYLSSPAQVRFSAASFRDWRIRRKILRQEFKRDSKYTSVAGFLLKERRYGEPCTACAMFGSGEPRTDACTLCYGVGVTGGYYAALGGIYCDFTQLEGQREEQQDQGRGTVKDVVEQGRFAGLPELHSRDLFVAETTGLRWSVERVTHAARERGFLLVQTAELRLLPLTSVLYQVPLGV